MSCVQTGANYKKDKGKLVRSGSITEKDEAEKQKVAEKDEGGPTVEHKSNQPQNRPKNSTVE